MRRRTRPVRPSTTELEPRLLRDGSVPPDPGPPPTPTISDQQWLGFYGLDDVPVEAPGGGVVPATGQGRTIVIVSVSRDASYLDSTNPNWMNSGLAVHSQAMGLNTVFSFTMVATPSGVVTFLDNGQPIGTAFTGQGPFATSNSSWLRIMIRPGVVRVTPWSPL